MRSMISICFVLLFLIDFESIFVSGSCTGLNNCNGHGKCSGNSSCECYAGWGATTDVTLYRAPDCSARTCPSGKAWGDRPTTVDTAHAIVECSNRGICDRKAGTCKCIGSFAGPACDRMTCPNDCSGHGKCLRMKDLAKYSAALPLEPNPHHYEVYQTTNAWDSEIVYGCQCDSSWSVGLDYGQTQLPEWFGPDCSLHRCPSGNDPQTRANETDCEGKRQNELTGKVYNISSNGTLAGHGLAGNLCHIDCSNRGVCDFSAGTCTCFDGFYGTNCNINDVLAGHPTDPFTISEETFAHLEF